MIDQRSIIQKKGVRDGQRKVHEVLEMPIDSNMLRPFQYMQQVLTTHLEPSKEDLALKGYRVDWWVQEGSTVIKVLPLGSNGLLEDSVWRYEVKYDHITVSSRKQRSCRTALNSAIDELMGAYTEFADSLPEPERQIIDVL